MGAAVNVKLAGPDTLGELGDVEAVHNGPVEGRNKPVESKGDEVDESEDDVSVLVHLVPEDDSTSYEPNHSGHVNCTDRGIAPESVVNPTEEGGGHRGANTQQVHHEAELVCVLAVSRECMEDC